MPKIGSSTPYSELPCSRCNSKRIVSKTWTEKIKITNGVAVIEHTQTVCTNIECQAKFEELLLEDNKKREKLRVIKEENAAKRKVNIKINKTKPTPTASASQ